MRTVGSSIAYLERPSATNPHAAYRHRQALLVVALGVSLLVSACGGRAAAPVAQAPDATAGITAVTTPAATGAAESGDAGPIPTLDLMKVPTRYIEPIYRPTQEIAPGPVELVRRFEVPTQNLGGLAVDRDGTIYVGTNPDGQILKYSPEGRLLRTWAGRNAMAVDRRGHVYVSTRDDYIYQYDSDGKLLRKWGGRGISNGQFNGVGDMAIDRHGNHYVVDSTNHRVQKFDPNGKYLLQWDTVKSDKEKIRLPMGIDMDARGNLYVVDPVQATVQKFDPSGKLLLMWGSEGTEPGQFEGAAVLAVDGRGDVYVADKNNGRIQKFDPNGKFLMQWDSSGDEPFVFPKELDIDGRGYLYVAEDRLERNPWIHIFRPR